MDAGRYDDTYVPPGAPGPAPGERIRDEAETLGQLVAGVVQDLQELFRAEIRLARMELQEDASTAGKAVGTMVAGGVVGLVGFIFLMLAVTWLLARWMPLWVAAGIVGVVLAAIAAALVLSGKNALGKANLAPEQTIATLKEDQQWARQQINSVKR